MIKTKKTQPINHQEFQDRANEDSSNSVDFYNKYVRKEGQKVLSEEEFIKRSIDREKARHTIDSKLKFHEYPLTPEQSFKL